ncbi:MAG: endonuclease [Flavobacterium sp.]|uniref:DNA-formamidopyrimidine glycosylase family protein n=1 Tax=Flavobacterium sp. TaxID=239 RepID=UPI001201BC53|nr:DNA-formamidopyrimidine glycosylase family protein [Flavobacterium sp.]RZJ65930.1 MAG: endonuclease [Flavobacterium sp.]
MPEGPTLVILKEQTTQFEGKVVTAVAGNTTIDLERLLHKKVKSLRTWGKHFLISFDGFYVRVHFLMFGSYSVDEDRKAKIRLGLTFKNGVLNFYASNIKLVEGKVEDDYDFAADIMGDKWDARKAKRRLNEIPDEMICDALLEQDIFSGSGNIIKTEVLYRARVHPESKTSKIPAAKMKNILHEVRHYAFEFLKWKKADELKKHWEAYTKKKCGRCDLPMHKKETGKKKRRSFFCTNCQKLYA